MAEGPVPSCPSPGDHSDGGGMRDGLPEDPGMGFLPSLAEVLVLAEHPLTCLAAPASHIVRICQGKKNN